MPIAVACACGARLKAPDAAAGKRVKCPKCAAPLLVPAPAAAPDFEFVDDEPAPTPVAKAVAAPVAKPKPQLIEDEDEPRPAKKKPKPVEVDEAVDDEQEDEKPRKKSRRDRDDDEDEKPKKKSRRDREDEDEKPAKKSRRSRDEGDEDDDDAPKKGKGKKGKKKSNLPLILGIGGGVLVLAAIAVVVVIAMSGNTDQTKGTNPGGTQPTQPQLPAGWSVFKGEGFSVAVPDAIQFKEIQQPPGGGGPGGPQANGKAYSNGIPVQPGQDATAYVVSVAPMPPAVAAEYAKSPEAGWAELKKSGGVGAQLREEKAIRVGGVDGRQFTLNVPGIGGLLRVAVVGDKVYTFAVMTRVTPAEDAPEVKPFFDTFKIE